MSKLRVGFKYQTTHDARHWMRHRNDFISETKKSKTTFKDLEPIKATEYNLLDAASQGAGSAAGLVNNFYRVVIKLSIIR